MDEALKTLIENPQLVPMLIAEYKPVVYAIGKEILAIYRDLINNGEWFELMAQHYESLYKALLRHGFTETQAIDIMLREMRSIDNYVKNSAKSN